MLHRLKGVNARLRYSKCIFAVKEVEHLGHVLSNEGVETSRKKVDAILKVPEPKNVADLRSFLGLVTYYGKFIPSLSSVAFPLNRLLCKDRRWSWGKAEKDAWSQLKKLLASNTVLCHYSSKLPLRLACDASSFGLGAVLSHVFPNGSERPVAYASRSLSPAEANYSQLDKEALAIIFGVQRFHQFIYGRRFELYTDHKPLLAILGPHVDIPTLAAARMLRWALILSAYNYSLLFRPTGEHGNADTLSRCPLPISGPTKEYDYVYNMECFSPTPLIFTYIQSATLQDPILRQVVNRLRQGWKEGDLCSELAPFTRRKLEFSLEGDAIL